MHQAIARRTYRGGRFRGSRVANADTDPEAHCRDQ
jgi:hypothetical protein